MAATLSVSNVANDATTRIGERGWFGGLGNLSIRGTFGGATVKLQYEDDGDTKHDTGISLTASGGDNFELPDGVDLYLNVTGGDGTTSISGEAKSINRRGLDTA